MARERITTKTTEVLGPMALALQAAAEAAQLGDVPVGAVIVDPAAGRILAVAGNRVYFRQDPTAHAELLVIRRAARACGRARLDGCDIWVTLEPCAMCAGAISLARLRRLYFGAYDPKGGGVEHGACVFSRPTCHHQPEVIGGMEERASGLLLRHFFAQRR